MNYRQWKKQYKKKHGYNPPKKGCKLIRAKIVKEELKQCNQKDDIEMCNQKAIKTSADIINKALYKICENIAAAFKKVRCRIWD